MTEEKKLQYKKSKIERLVWLKEQYRRLQIGANSKERLALACESAVLQKRLEVTSRGGH